MSIGIKSKGIPKDLIELRDEFNRRIACGFCMFKGVEIERAFISNMRSYWKIYLLSINREMFEHGIEPNLLLKRIRKRK